MARTHFGSFYQDASGAPIESADVSIYLAGTEEPAAIYTNEFGTAALTTAPQLKTNALGYFEFGVADNSDSVAGYNNTQKFKITATRTGVADMMIDYVDILCSILPVDVNSDNTVANKAVSNAMAKAWNSMLIYQGMPVGRPGDTSIDSDEMNKFVSNNLITRGQDHRKMNFNTNINFYGTVTESELLPGEDLEHFPNQYGAHGILGVQIDGTDRSDTVLNRLVSNALANKGEEHVDYSFYDHDISAPDFNEPTPHGLRRANFAIPAFDLEDPNAPHELVKEYNQYNKLVSNRLIREIYNEAEIKVAITVRLIKKADGTPSTYEKNIWVNTITHNLNTRFIGVECHRKIERINPFSGAVEVVDNIFSPEDIFIISENEIEIHASKEETTYVTIGGRRDLLKAMNEDDASDSGSGDTDWYRLLIKSNVATADVQIEGDI